MSEIYRFAGLELDTSRYQIRRAGKTLAVQPQVFDVLHYLVANHDRIVSKDELIDKIWNRRFISDATLSSRIKAVRQLLGDTGKQQHLLQTLRHRGFRYTGPVECELQGTRPIASAVASTPANPPTAIAVLPFEWPGNDADEAHLGQGIAADIIALLARHHWLTVIARGSSFAVDPRATPQQIGALLGVSYLLTGRIRRVGLSGRIDAELADCNSSRLLWNQSYPIENASLNTVLEEITQQIAATIEPRLAQLEWQKTERKRPEDFRAWDYCHKALWHLYRFTVEDLEAARGWFRKALELDLGLARAHAGLAYVSVQLAFYGPPVARTEELQQALSHSQSAVAAEPGDAFSRFALGRSLCLLGRNAEAERELEQAIEANRSFAQAYFALGFCLAVGDRPAASLPLFERALRLSPQDPHLWTFHHIRALALFRLDRLEEAEDYVRAAVRQPYVTYWPLATLCAVLAERGRLDEARAIGERLRQVKPGYDLAYARQDFFFMQAPEFVERYLHDLALAGIPAR